jgi:hypothetical protein
VVVAHPLLIRRLMSAKPALRRTATIHGIGPISAPRPALQRLETQRWFGEGTPANEIEEPMPLSRRRSVPTRPSAFPFMFELPRTSPVGPLLLLAIAVAGLIAAIAITLR